MPIYEYRRQDGTTFEVLQKFSDPPLTADPESGEPVQRVLHAPAIHFKGKGFHNTDYGTRRRNRELETSAEKGADAHDDKMRSKREEAKKAESAKPKTETPGSGGSSSSGSSSSSSSSSPAKKD